MRIDSPRGLRQSCCPMRRTALLLTLGIASVAGAQDSDVFILQEHTPAPAFSLRDLSGKTVDSKSLAGKVAVLCFGAMHGRGDKDVKLYLEKHGHTIRTLIAPEMAVAREHGVRWLPVTVVRDRKGMIVGRAIGAREWDGKEALEFIQPLIRR